MFRKHLEANIQYTPVYFLYFRLYLIYFSSGALENIRDIKRNRRKISYIARKNSIKEVHKRFALAFIKIPQFYAWFWICLLYLSNMQLLVILLQKKKQALQDKL